MISPELTTRRTDSSLVRVGIIVFLYILVFWVILPAFLIGTGLRLDVLWPINLSGAVWTFLLGWLLVVAGFGIMAPGMYQLWRQGKGLPISHLPPTTLVSSGLYRYFRHPIYVGYTLAFGGVALLLHSFWTLVFSTPLLLVGWICYALFYEEPRLVARFGESYETHRGQTRLLWPASATAGFAQINQMMRTALYARLNKLANRPMLYQRGHFMLVTYGALCALGGFFWAESLSMSLTQHGLDFRATGWFILGIAVATSIGASVFWWIGNWRTLRHEVLWGLGRIGFISYGGLLAVCLFAVAFAYVQPVSALVLLDAVMQGMYFAYAFGRLGCLTYGCCYGACTSSEFGIRYVHPDAKLYRERHSAHCVRRPVQYYAFVHGLLMIVAIGLISQGAIPAGLLTAFTLMLGGLGRTVTESYRERERTIGNRFTQGHLGSWVMFITGWIMLFLIAPGGDVGSPVPWTWRAFTESIHLMPVVLGSAALILVIYGVHWKKLGYRFGG